MIAYIRAQTKTNEAIIHGSITTDELHRLSKADLRWAENRSKSFPHITFKKGEIYQFEFGKNYAPEMSYEHRGLILGVNQRLLYVLPIFSYRPEKHIDVFHPTDSPDSHSNLFLLKQKEHSFLQHDSVLKLNDIRTISVHRALYKHEGRIDVNSDTYQCIEHLVLQKYFFPFYYQFSQQTQQMEEQAKHIQDLEQTIAQQTKQIAEQAERIQALEQELAQKEQNTIF